MHATLGADLYNRLSAELQANILGTAELRPEGEVDYAVYSLSAILYGLNSTAERNSRTDWSAYLRGGLGKMTNSASIDFVRRNDYHLVLGAGTEYGFENGLALRGEYIHYDTDAAFVGVDAQSALKGRDGALVTVVPLAYPAGNADRLVGRVAPDIQIIGIDDLAGMADFTPQSNRETPPGRAPGPPRFGDVMRQTEVPRPIWCFGQLAQKLAGGFESVVGVP